MGNPGRRGDMARWQEEQRREVNLVVSVKNSNRVLLSSVPTQRQPCTPRLTLSATCLFPERDKVIVRLRRLLLSTRVISPRHYPPVPCGLKAVLAGAILETYGAIFLAD